MLACEEMVTVRTAALDVRVTDAGVLPGDAPGLGAVVDPAVLGDPVQVWGG